MRFEWDAIKAASNIIKHGVSFEEAIEVFYDPNALEDVDAAHSVEETRFVYHWAFQPALVIHRLC